MQSPERNKRYLRLLSLVRSALFQVKDANVEAVGAYSGVPRLQSVHCAVSDDAGLVPRGVDFVARPMDGDDIHLVVKESKRDEKRFFNKIRHRRIKQNVWVIIARVEDSLQIVVNRLKGLLRLAARPFTRPFLSATRLKPAGRRTTRHWRRERRMDRMQPLPRFHAPLLCH